MKIIDLENRTGLDRATIRYYEKEGLITPARLENGYREYSAADEEQLLKIKLLRQLGMSLDKIKNLQQGIDDFGSALTDQIQALERKVRSMDRAKEICSELRSAGVTYAALDAAEYLRKLAEPTGLKVTKTYHEPAVRKPYHPVLRYVARMFDYLLIRSTLLFLLVVILRIRPYGDFLSNLVLYGTPFLAVPLIALMLTRFGTTPGKWIMGLSVDYYNGGHLDYSSALNREWNVLRYGMGFGIPIWKLWKNYKSYKNYGDSTDMEWDYECEYIYRSWNHKKKIAFFSCFLAILLINVFSALDISKPHYRGDLMIAEFASNYNYYLSNYIDTPAVNDLLEEDGSWGENITTENSIVIVVGNQSENRDFTYTMEGETITRIQYENTWTDIMGCNPLKKPQIAAVTMLMSQRHTNIFDLYELDQLWSSIGDKKSGSITCENIEIRWEIQSVNCFVSTDNIYWAKNNDLDSSVTLYFELIVH